jgi:hypothetical protein
MNSVSATMLNPVLLLLKFDAKMWNLGFPHPVIMFSHRHTCMPSWGLAPKMMTHPANHMVLAPELGDPLVKYFQLPWRQVRELATAVVCLQRHEAQRTADLFSRKHRIPAA